MKDRCRYAWVAVSLALTAGVIASGITGCQTDGNRGAEGQPEFSIRASRDSVLKGEIVTLTTRSSNLAGRQSKIEWMATGGEVNTEENGRIARVQFDRPGTYTVSAKLIVDDELAESDSVSIEVRPVTSQDR